jgi:hypothetical protein
MEKKCPLGRRAEVSSLKRFLKKFTEIWRLRTNTAGTIDPKLGMPPPLAVAVVWKNGTVLPKTKP